MPTKKTTAPKTKAKPAAKKVTATKTKPVAKKAKPTSAKPKAVATKVKPTAVKAKPAKEKKSKVAEIKTSQNDASVEAYMKKVESEQRRKDGYVILEMMKKASKEEPKMWGSSIIGFGKKRYKSPTTDREVDFFLIGFSPRKASLTIYLMGLQKHQDALKKLGKHKQSTGGGCLHINKLEDIDLKVLKGMIEASLK